MPGRSRIDVAGALHHIMVRGIERIELFRGDTDSNHFAERPLDSGHGLWPWALARDRVPSEGKSSRGPIFKYCDARRKIMRAVQIVRVARSLRHRRDSDKTTFAHSQLTHKTDVHILPSGITAHRANLDVSGAGRRRKSGPCSGKF
jgi:hypothetical protein